MLERGKITQIANALGVSKQYISAILKGERAISGDMVLKILQVAPELEGKFAVKEWNKVRYIFRG